MPTYGNDYSFAFQTGITKFVGQYLRKYRLPDVASPHRIQYILYKHLQYSPPFADKRSCRKDFKFLQRNKIDILSK